MANDLKPLEATLLTINVIDAQLQQDQMGPFEDGKTIPDDPPKGYRFSDNRYQDFCTKIAVTLSAAAGRRLTLDDAFRNDHFNGTMGAFAADVAAKLREAPLGANVMKLAALAKQISRGRGFGNPRK